jgi:hypothetical protein
MRIMPPASSCFRLATTRKDWFDSGLFRFCTWALLFSCVILQIISNLPKPMDSFDESIALVSAELVRHGRLPGIDFLSSYPPLSYYLLAAAFRLTGETVLALYALDAILYCVLIIAVAKLFGTLAGRLRPLAPWMSLMVALAIGDFIRPNWLGSSSALLTVVVYAAGVGRAKPGVRSFLAAVGALAGLSTLLRFNFGLYAACVVVIDLVMEQLRAAHQAFNRVWFRRLAADLGAFMVPFLLVNVAFWVSVYHGKALFALVDVFTTSKATTGSMRFIDVSRLQGAVVAWPCAWVFLSEVLTSGRLSKRALLALAPVPVLLTVLVVGRALPAVAPVLTALGALSVLFLYVAVGGFGRAEFCFLLYLAFSLHYYFTRADEYHLVQMMTILKMGIPLLVLPLSRTNPESGRDFARGVAFVLLAIVIGLGVTGFGALWRPDLADFLDGLRCIGGAASRISDADRLAARDTNSPWIYAQKGEVLRRDESDAIAFIRAKTAPEETIFVGAQDHSRVYVNDLRIYWLAQRMPCCRVIDMSPDVMLHADVQAQIISDLNRNRVRWAILESNAETGHAAATFFRRVRPGARLLDDFLAANYEPAASFGTFSVRARKSPF